MIELTYEELKALRGILEQVSATGKKHLILTLGIIKKVEAELQDNEPAKQLRDPE